jgi:hypothetical protein
MAEEESEGEDGKDIQKRMLFTPIRIGVGLALIQAQHLLLGVHSIHIAVVTGIASAHARDADPRFVVVETILSARAGIKAVATANIAWVISTRRYLVPLQCLKSRVLCEQCCRQDKITTMLTLYTLARNHQGLRNGMQVLLLLIHECAFSFL